MIKRELMNVPLVETLIGSVTITLPPGAHSGYLMIEKHNGGKFAYQGILQAGTVIRNVSSVIGPWAFVYVTFTLMGKYYTSQKIQVGPHKVDPEALSWEKIASEYRDLIRIHRRQAHVHGSMASKAEQHLRPVGAKAHKEAKSRHEELQAMLERALKSHSVLDDDDFKEKKAEAEEVTIWANRQDSVFPEGPEQKWYTNIHGKKYLRAKSQLGWNRIPHHLKVEGDSLELLLHSDTYRGDARYCTSLNWSNVHRGFDAWKLLSSLTVTDLKELQGAILFLQLPEHKGQGPTCSFRIPRDPKPTVPEIPWGTYVRNQRKHLKLSQASLAKLLTMSASTISRWERGKNVPWPETQLVVRLFFEDMMQR